MNYRAVSTLMQICFLAYKYQVEKTSFCYVQNLKRLVNDTQNKGPALDSAIIALNLTHKSFLILRRHRAGVSYNFGHLGISFSPSLINQLLIKKVLLKQLKSLSTTNGSVSTLATLTKTVVTFHEKFLARSLRVARRFNYLSSLQKNSLEISFNKIPAERKTGINCMLTYLAETWLFQSGHAWLKIMNYIMLFYQMQKMFQ